MDVDDIKSLHLEWQKVSVDIENEGIIQLIYSEELGKCSSMIYDKYTQVDEHLCSC